MSSDAPIPLELVEDDFTEEEHQTMDLDLCQGLPELNSANFDTFAPSMLCYMTMQVGDHASGITWEDCSRLIQDQPALRKLLLDGSYKSVRRWSKDSSSSTPSIC